jgi:endonuclease/exonuclease/phosphatase family metal-dependent hydrolase
MRRTSVRPRAAPPAARLRRFVAALVTTLLAGCSAASVPQPAAHTIRIMTYNIFSGKDLQRQPSLERVAAFMDSLDVDIIFLQEVDRHTRRSGDADQAAILAGLTGRHVVFGRSMDFDGGEYGNAILSRWPVRTWRVVPLPAPDSPEPGAAAAEPRSLLYVTVEAPGGALHLLNTHLDHREASLARHAQALELMDWVAASLPPQVYVIFGGDLNARPDAPEVRALAARFSDVWPACGSGDGYTFRSDVPDRRIDYIMLAGLHCTAARVPDRQLSDHRPVVVDVAMPGSPPAAVR